MAEHLLTETFGPAGGPGCAAFVRDAAALAGAGHGVRLLLVENGVAAAVQDAVPDLAVLLAVGGEVWVDRYSLERRGIDPGDLVGGARLVELDEVAGTLLESGVRVVWH